MLQDKNKITLAIVDDHPVVIQGLEKLFSNDKRITITGSFTTGAEFVAFIKKNKVQIVLLDITLPDISGPDLCKTIKLISPATCVLGFSSHGERVVIMQLLQHGASGYLLKNISAEEMQVCIEEALNGEITFSKEVKKIMARHSVSELKPVPRLTKREKQILQLIADGKTNAVIAEQLSLSTLTVETHRKNLMQKFEVKNSAALIKTAMEQQLL
jgi:DNA-binding NarL/FixJ family response regulator